MLIHMISYDPYPVIPWEWKWTWLLCSVLRIVAVHPCCNAATCCTMTCWWKATIDIYRPHAVTLTCRNRWIPMDFDGFWWCHCFPMPTRRVAVEAQVFHGLCHLLQEGSMLELCLENHFGGFWRIETYPFFGEFEPRSILDHCICWMITANSCPPLFFKGSARWA